METLWQDIRYGVRTLLKNPSFTIVVVLTLGLGIGANTAVFSVINTLLLRPLPAKDPGQLVVIAVKHEGNLRPHPPSYLDYLDFKQQSDAFSDVSGCFVDFVGLATEGRAERITVSFVSPTYFTMLGIQPAVGRLLLPSEGIKPGADPVLVLGHSYWKKRFGGDRGVVGRAVRVNGQSYTIVGVVPEEFHGTYAIAEFDAYFPLAMAAGTRSYKDSFERRDNHDLRVIARLNPGASLRQAQSSLDVIAKRLEAQYPDTNKTVTAHVYPERLARPEPNSAEENPLVASVFLLLTILVLLVACVNVANLLLVRGTLRHKELAIRAAMGAGPVRLVRQLLTESILLALMGGAAGVLIGLWVTNLMAQIKLPGDLPFRFEFGFDWRVFAYVCGIAVFAGIVVGILPAWKASRADVNDALREGGRSMAAGGGRHRARNILVVCQVAGSLVLLIAAGLFVRSLTNAQTVDLGFNPRNVINLSMDPAQQGYDETRTRNFFRELEQRVRALPGVESAGLAFSVPMGYYNQAEYVAAEGQEVTDQKRLPAASFNMIGTDYFRTMGIHLQKGRVFTEQDTQTSTPVAIVNEFMARTFWPGQDPIGKRFTMMGANAKPGPPVEVVGVARDGKFRYIFEDPGMFFWLPLEQRFSSLRALHVRTTLPPETLAGAIQNQIRSLDAELPIYDVMTMENGLEGGNGFFLIRMGAVFAGALGLLGLLLAVVGVYGVVSYSASQRSHEIGIRMALGAERRDILKLIVGQGLALVLIGIGAGLLLAFAGSRVISNLLFGIKSYDPITFAGVALLLGAIAVLACWIPARRASRLDPLVALRYE